LTKDQLKSIAEAVILMQQASEILEPIAQDERDKFEELSEKAQEGERGEKIGEDATTLETAVSHLGDAIACCEELT
jgi:hypothetical protein